MNNAKVQNALVYLSPGNKETLGKASGGAQLEKATIRASGCVYRPRVLDVRVGQFIEISTRESHVHHPYFLTTENKHPEEYELSSESPQLVRFDKQEIGIKLRCRIHPWMQSYIHVLPTQHTFVTGKDGTFTFSDVSPGKYVVKFWHEHFGVRDLHVTIKAGTSQEVNVDFFEK